MLFIDNKYTRTYYRIIERAQHRVLNSYVEKHHIIPKSLGGPDHNSNIARLTAREHFICHLLLTKMTNGSARSKMVLAVFFLTGAGKGIRNNKIKSSRLYENLKIDLSSIVSKQKRGCKQPPKTEEGRRNLSKSKMGKKNPSFKCEWVTPWGVYESSRQAATACPSFMSAGTILKFCQTKNSTPITYLSVCRSKGWVTMDHVGLTPYELGFSINKI